MLLLILLFTVNIFSMEIENKKYKSNIIRPKEKDIPYYLIPWIKSPSLKCEFISYLSPKNIPYEIEENRKYLFLSKDKYVESIICGLYNHSGDNALILMFNKNSNIKHIIQMLHQGLEWYINNTTGEYNVRFSISTERINTEGQIYFEENNNIIIDKIETIFIRSFIWPLTKKQEKDSDCFEYNPSKPMQYFLNKFCTPINEKDNLFLEHKHEKIAPENQTKYKINMKEMYEDVKVTQFQYLLNNYKNTQKLSLPFKNTILELLGYINYYLIFDLIKLQ